ncbi:hypothetical protein RJ53_07620 [Methanocalculus chunghsingensis]|uniref:Uncharacterized protein n=1 Tax=Methanocalculus chunghsingensis TaxID=156457 RepID=A0A8J8B5T0_9EURY|nr:hypothetical protein [Methanocalculus chunghsingensis]MBR1369369.1 hypothetical protein [Methanocalculus chunghsingensis]
MDAGVGGDGNRLSGVSINKAAEQMIYRVGRMSEEEVQREIQELREMVKKQEKRIDRLEKFAIAAYREMVGSEKKAK